MGNFVGIDLGTTNSAICTYDGSSEPRIWKSKEQNDVTPSVIYFDRRGGKHIGHRAYDVEPIYHKSCAKLFKRRIGEDSLIELPAVDRTLTPEECSAEILKELFSYLPEEIRISSDIGTVVTVPAVFNMKARSATRHAAEIAGFSRVEVMQEPVAAVMSFMLESNTDGTFLIYDLGGGTFDVAIAQTTGSRINLLAHGGIEVCGGRDFDRLIADNVILPYLYEEYNLPNDLTKDKSFEKFIRIIQRSAEQAKIELSATDESIIQIPGRDDWFDHLQDLNGEEIDQGIPLQREVFNRIITEKINDTIICARKTMEECGVSSQDIERIVWVGGPTHYKPLRDKVALELEINGEISNLNPMTAVAEGASLFAESIDWSSNEGRVKTTRGQISTDELGLSFNYTARTPSDTSKIAVQVDGQVPDGFEFQVDNLDSGTTSGRFQLKHAVTIDVTLTKPGENTFKVVVYNDVGEQIVIKQDEIVITKTAATVETIPAPHSIALEVLERSGGRPILVNLIKKNDPLPFHDVIQLTANEELKAGSDNSLNFNLWEGEFEDSINSNEWIGVFKIEGDDFDEGVIPLGAELIYNYEIKTSGEINVEVSIPAISRIFEAVYSPDEGKSDYTTNAKEIVEDGISVGKNIDEIKSVVDDPKLEQAKKKLDKADALDSDESDPEKVKEAEQGITQAKELLEEVSRKNRKEICQIELTKELTFFDLYCRQHARPSEEKAFDSLVETAGRSIENNDSSFDDHINELRMRIFEILWRQPWFIIERFKNLIRTPHAFTDQSRFEELAARGRTLLGHDVIRRYEELSPEEKYKYAMIDDGTIDELREIVRNIMSIHHIGAIPSTDSRQEVNVVRAQ